MKGAPRGRLWLFRLLALVGGPLLFFLLVETALRLGGAGFDPRFFVSVPGRQALTTNPAFGWRFFPKSQARRPVPADIAADKSPGRERVIVLGGSAAMGIPDPAFSFGRILEVMLESDGVGRDVEMINAAMTAINSHVVREIAGELGRIEPDAVLIYMGNNEVVGPFGIRAAGPTPDGAEAGPTHRGPTPLGAVRARLWMTKLRTGQTGVRLLEPRAKGGWRGMEAFAGHRVLPGDPRLDRTYLAFADNLRDIIGRARKSGARVFVSTVAVDLFSTPPFASAELDARQASEVEALLESARESIHQAESPDAVEAARRAAAIAPDHAGAHYWFGRGLATSGGREASQAALERARDLDALRFRADSEINALIRRVAEEEGAVLVDAADLLARRSPHGTPGREFFFEHVHFTFEGAYELARAFFLAWEAGQGSSQTVDPPSKQVCAEALGFGAWQELGQLTDIEAMMSRPPFTFQAGHGQRMLAVGEQRRRLEQRLDGEAFELTKSRLEKALAARPGDLFLDRALADLLRTGGDGHGALSRLEPLLERLPEAPGLWLDAGNAALTAGDLARARSAYERASELDPHSADGPFNLGALAVREGRFEEAFEDFQRALELDPNHLEARLNAAAALDELRRPEEALVQFRRAVELAPNRPAAVLRLAAALEARGQSGEAAELVESAAGRFPQDARAQVAWARHLEAAGDGEAAIRHYALALRVDPDHAPALTGLVELHNRRASEMAAGGDISAATVSLRKALAADPEHGPSHFNLAMILGRAGRVEDAVFHLQEAYLGARRSGLEALENEAESRLRALGRLPVEHSAEK